MIGTRPMIAMASLVRGPSGSGACSRAPGSSGRIRDVPLRDPRTSPLLRRRFCQRPEAARSPSSKSRDRAPAARTAGYRRRLVINAVARLCRRAASSRPWVRSADHLYRDARAACGLTDVQEARAARLWAISSGAAVGIVPSCYQCQPYHDGKVKQSAVGQLAVDSRSRQAVKQSAVASRRSQSADSQTVGGRQSAGSRRSQSAVAAVSVAASRKRWD